MRIFLVSALCLGGSGGCETRPEEPAGVSLEVRAPDGAAPSTYELVVTTPDAGPFHVSCGGALALPSGPLACAPGGGRLDVAEIQPALTVTVKARGFATATLDLAPASTVALPLAPLGAAVATPDYRTAFSTQTGATDFAEMAYAVDTELGPTQVVKFYIDGLDAVPAVYFQNTKLHPIHYDFVHNVLGKPLSLSQFEAQTYAGADRKAMAGSLVWYPSLAAVSAAAGGLVKAPLAVTFFPSDDLTPAQARRAGLLIEARLGFASLSGGDARIAYLPAGSQQEADLAGEVRAFAAADLVWLTTHELYGSLARQLLNPGVAYGTLRLMTPEALETAVVSFSDILLLTRLPNSLPLVGGTITEELQTPLAHVNLAARARGTPNLALLGASTDPAVAPFLDAIVRFEVTSGGYSLAAATLEDVKAFWAASAKQTPAIPPADVAREGLLDFAEIGFEDSDAVGAKGANLAELSHLLGSLAPEGFAVPFHYYDAFMQVGKATPSLCNAAQADCTAEGREASLCQAARGLCDASVAAGESLFAFVERLRADAGFQTTTAVREACLDALRYLIRHLPVDDGFGGALDALIALRFGEAPVRLRSSTNVEDLPSFSGAGLYTSATAYASGKDRASEEIRKVWASVWSFKAFEERAFWNVDHAAVRMAVPVHPAFPDEVANGVLITQNLANPAVVGMYVNVQAGEVSVTNPTGGALPEIFSILPGAAGLQVARQRFSSLSPETPLLSQAEVAALYSAAAKVQVHFAPLYGVDPFVLKLDLEFKFHGAARALIVKQTRPYFEAP